MRENLVKLSIFIITSYSLATLVDLAGTRGLHSLLWGFLRMWSPSVAAILCLYIFREDLAESLRRFIGFRGHALKWFFSAPLLVYLALAIYVVIAYPAGFFSVEAYVDDVSKRLLESGVVRDVESARSIALLTLYANIGLGYIAGLTINSLFALGEEIGWRGYLYNLLKDKPTHVSSMAIGVVWGYWHAPAIILLGFNYQIERFVGALLLFPALTTVLTYTLISLVRVSGSILPAASLHGTLNALWSLTILASYLSQREKELYLGVGVLGIVSWLLVALMIYALRRARVIRETSLKEDLKPDSETRDPWQSGGFRVESTLSELSRESQNSSDSSVFSLSQSFSDSPAG